MSAGASAVLRLAGGGEARIVASSGEAATLETAEPAPPGATLELEVLASPLRFKVRRCHRVADAGNVRYRIEGRWVNLSRAQRQHLLG